MKLILVLWIAFNDVDPSHVSGYEFESEAACTVNLQRVEKENPLVKGVCVTEEMWEAVTNE